MLHFAPVTKFVLLRMFYKILNSFDLLLLLPAVHGAPWRHYGRRVHLEDVLLLAIGFGCLHISVFSLFLQASHCAITSLIATVLCFHDLDDLKLLLH